MPDFSLSDLEAELQRRETYAGPFYTGKAQFKGMSPDFMGNFDQMAQDYYRQTGKPLSINDAFRTAEMQAEAYRNKPTLAAKPGHSLHERGMAMDLDEAQANQLAEMGLLDQYGFERPMLGKGASGKNEPWHIQMADLERRAEATAAQTPYKLADLEAELARREGKGSTTTKPPFALEDLEKELARREAATTDATSDTLAQFAGPAGEMVGEAIDLPMKPIRAALGKIHDVLIEPQRAGTEQEFGKYVQEPGVGTAAPEAFAGLPNKEAFVDTLSTAMTPTVYNSLAKILSAAGASAESAYFKNAPQWFMKLGEQKIDLPAVKGPVTEADFARVNEFVKGRLQAERATPMEAYKPPGPVAKPTPETPPETVPKAAGEVVEPQPIPVPKEAVKSYGKADNPVEAAELPNKEVQLEYLNKGWVPFIYKNEYHLATPEMVDSKFGAIPSSMIEVSKDVFEKARVPKETPVEPGAPSAVPPAVPPEVAPVVETGEPVAKLGSEFGLRGLAAKRYTVDGHAMGDTPAEAIEQYYKFQEHRESARLIKEAEEEVYPKLKSGNYTEQDIKRITNYGKTTAPTGESEGILRELGMKSTEARKLIQQIPHVYESSRGTTYYDVRELVEAARKKGFLPPLEAVEGAPLSKAKRERELAKATTPPVEKPPVAAEVKGKEEDYSAGIPPSYKELQEMAKKYEAIQNERLGIGNQIKELEGQLEKLQKRRSDVVAKRTQKYGQMTSSGARILADGQDYLSIAPKTRQQIKETQSTIRDLQDKLDTLGKEAQQVWKGKEGEFKDVERYDYDNYLSQGKEIPPERLSLYPDKPTPKKPLGEEGAVSPDLLVAPARAVIEDTAALLKGAPEQFRTAGTAIKESATKAWDYYKSPIETKERGYHRILNDYLGERQIHGKENADYLRTITKAIPDKVRREAMVNWIQAGGDTGLLQQRATESTGSLKKGYEAALSLTPEEQTIAQEISAKYDYYLQEAQAAGILEHGLEDYVNQLWKRNAAKKDAIKKLYSEINAGLLNTNFKYAKKRIFDNYFEGEKAGYTPANKDIAFLLGHYDQSMYEAIAARRFIKSLTESTADDGRPAVSVFGSGQQITPKMEEKPFSDVPGEYDMTEAKGPDAYLIRPRAKPEETADYRIIDHPALRKWKWVGKDPDGKPIYLQGDLAVHPEIYRHLNNVLKKSALREHALGRGALKVSQNLKGVLLSGLPTGFHQVHVGSHAAFHKVNPFTAPPIDLKNPVQQRLVKNGLLVYNHNALAEFAEGLHSTGLAAKVPGIGRITQMYGEYLFQDLIPRLKMKMGVEAYERNAAKYKGKYTEDQIAEITSNQSNAAFGEMNLKAMGRNPTMQDVFRLMSLAPDFLEARLRFAGQALRPGGSEQRWALFRAILGMYGAGVVGNMLLSDDKKPHWDKPFTVIIGKNAYSLRSVPGDMWHLISDPRSFVYHRLNPSTSKPLAEFLSGRDVYGRLRNTGEQIGDYFKGAVPIPLQSFVSEGERTLMQGALQTLGVTSYKAKSKFDKFVSDYYQSQARLNIPPEERELSKQRRDIIKDFREGKTDQAFTKLEKLSESGKVKDKTIDAWLTRQGVFIDENGQVDVVSEREAQMHNLPLKVAVDAALVATDEEKKDLMPILEDKLDKADEEDIEKLEPKLKKLFPDVFEEETPQPEKDQGRFSILDYFR